LGYRIAEESRQSLGQMPYVAWQVWGSLRLLVGGKEPFEVTPIGLRAHPDLAAGTIPEVYLLETFEAFMESCYTLAAGEGYEVGFAGTGLALEVTPLDGGRVASRMAVPPEWKEFVEPQDELPEVPLDAFTTAVKGASKELLAEVETLLAEPSLYRDLMAFRGYLDRLDAYVE
jgi:hypothetical protein